LSGRPAAVIAGLDPAIHDDFDQQQRLQGARALRRMSHFPVMAGLVPAIRVFAATMSLKREAIGLRHSAEPGVAQERLLRGKLALDD
jgi:hypothetical protein